MPYSEVPRIELNQNGTVTFFVNIGGFRVNTPVEISGYATQTNGATATFRSVQLMPQGDPVAGVIVVVTSVPVIGPAFTAQDPIMVVAQAADVWVTKLNQDAGGILSQAIQQAKAQNGQLNPRAAWNSDGTTYHSMFASTAMSGVSGLSYPQPAASGQPASSPAEIAAELDLSGHPMVTTLRKPLRRQCAAGRCRGVLRRARGAEALGSWRASRGISGSIS